MRKYFDVVFYTTSIPVANALVYVTDSNGNLAQLYSDNGVTLITNPTRTDSTGFYSFYVVDGIYTLKYVIGPITLRTLTGVQIYDESTASGVPNEIANGTATSAGTLTGTETVPVSRGAGLLQTTWNTVATFVLSIFTVLFSAGIGAVVRTILAKMGDQPITPQDFGAKGNGVVGQNVGADDTVAIQNWLNALSPTVSGYIPPGVYNLSARVSKSAANNISIKTAGAGAVVFNYTGASTTTDIISLGDPGKVTSSSYWSVGGFSVESATKMTAGAAVRVQKFMVYSYFDEIACGTHTNNGNLYHGAWLDLVNVFHLPTISVTKCQGDGLRFNGSASDDSGSDVFLTRGNISFCANGLHQGGGMGGLRTGQLNSFANGINYLFDTTIVARKNREVFYEPASVCDGASVAGIVFDDMLTSNAPVSLEGFIGSSGQLVTGTGPYHGVWIKNWPAGRIALKSAEVFNHLGNGIQKDDQSCLLTISPDTHLFNNSGYAVSAENSDTNIYYFGGYAALNLAGNFNENAQLANGDTFTPVVTAATGALGAYTATMRWSKMGKIATWTMFISITNIGTASGSLNITLPFQTRLSVVVTGMDVGGSGKALHGFISSNASIQSVANFDNSFPAQNGSVLVLSGSCEVA